MALLLVFDNERAGNRGRASWNDRPQSAVDAQLMLAGAIRTIDRLIAIGQRCSGERHNFIFTLAVDLAHTDAIDTRGPFRWYRDCVCATCEDSQQIARRAVK